MKQSNISKIIKKYLSDRFPQEAEEKVQKWIIKEKDTEEKEKASLDYWNELDSKNNPDTYLALKRVNQKIGYPETRIIPFRQRLIRIAAVMIPILIITGSYWYYTATKNPLIEISVAYGEKKHLLLPDNSEIWLNAGTVFKYPKKFTDARRLVYLDGEAYFSVTRDAAKPFIVNTSQLSVKVLGTKFNVKAYTDDKLVTATLTSGKVEVTPSTQSPRLLAPNEQLTFNKHTSDVSVTTIPPADTNGWITGKLIFTNASFTEILHTLERRYNLTINSTIDIPASKRYTVRFLKNENPDEILAVLEEVIGFGYRKQGNTIELIQKQ